MDFAEIEKKFLRLYDGVCARIDFPNSYGVSIVRHSESAGGPHGLYEVVIVKDGVFTGECAGWLDNDALVERVNQVAAR